ncbi:MAG: transposase [Treponema sp.]|nr:transposase [Treponema sp.]
MRKNRVFVADAFYHITSRTNDKIRVFENRLGRKIMLLTLHNAKNKYHFRLANFCIMPTHIHLLIKPASGTYPAKIMQWIKTNSAKHWNQVHGSKDHLWGDRYFARPVRSPQEFEFVMNYIDQNAVKAGLVPNPADWKASGAYYKARNISGLVDFDPHERQPYVKLLSPIPPLVSRLMPQAQLEYTLKYYGVFAEAIHSLYTLIPTIPQLGESAFLQKPPICLHYSTGITDYYIYEFDGYDSFYGRVHSTVNPVEPEYTRFSLSALKNNPLMKLEVSVTNKYFLRK